MLHKSSNLHRVLVLAPTKKDAEVSLAVLSGNGLFGVQCDDIESLVRKIELGAGAVLLTEELLTDERVDYLARSLRAQPAWSKLPFVILMRGGTQSVATASALRALENVTLLERPAPVRSVVSAVQAALRARVNQYELRDYIERIRRSENFAQKSEERYRRLVDSSPDAMLVSFEGRIVFANPASTKLLGSASVTGILGRAFSEFLPESNRAPALVRERSLVLGGAVSVTEETIIRLDGRHVDSELTTVVIPWRESTALQHILRDLSARKRAEAESFSRAKELGAIMDATPAIVMIARDREAQLVTGNRAAYEFFHLPPGANLSRADADCRARFALHRSGEELSAATSPIQQSAREGVERRDQELQIRFNDGNVRYLFGHVVPLKDSSGASRGAIAVFVDTTDLHAAAEERKALLISERAARSEAEHAARMKDEFLAVLSHELRTPLNAILGWLQLLRRGQKGAADVKQGMDVIERSARLQAKLIEDLLDMSRITSGKLHLELGPIQISEVMDAAIESIRPAARERGVEIERSLDTEVVTTGDFERIQQVLWNLLSNAVKFTPAGGRVVVRGESRGPEVVITVADTGTGIPPEFLPHVFERFRQADSSLRRRFGGLGLGLAIVKHLTELHGGSVEVTSPGLGLGSTFTVRLPLASPFGSAEIGNGSLLASTHESLANLSGARVLVIDDDPDSRNLVTRFLEDCGARITTAGSAREGLDLCASCLFDVIISDIGMPDMDGYEFIRRLRALSSATCAVPAAALTAFARSEDRETALQAGYQAHLSKPIDQARLVSEVSRLVQQGSSLVCAH